ncbi:MAG: GNAT family N-acetyltransferase [Thermodesulfobacteriota bacterium]
MTEDTSYSQTEASEIQIARLTVLADDRYLGAVTDLIADIAKVTGLDEESARKLDAIIDEVLQKIFEYGYEGDTTQSVHVVVSRRAHSLVIAIEDKGLPFDYLRIEQRGDPRFSSFLSKGYADQVHFVNLGPSGNRVELVKELPSAEVRYQSDTAVHPKTLDTAEAHPEEALTTRIMRPEEAVDLARLVNRCYGYTYPSEFVYYPQQVEAKQRAGLMKSFAVYNSRGEMVGHIALTFDHPGAKVAESGQAVVDPRYRGHKIFERMKHYLLDYAVVNQIIGIYGEAVTVHPFSQKGNLALGAHEVGFLVGYSPGTVSFRSIADQKRPRRQSIALMYTSVLKSAPASIFAPGAYHMILRHIYDVLGIEREIVEVKVGRTNECPQQTGRIKVSIRRDHNQAVLNVEVIGQNTFDEIRFHLKQLCLNHFECIYADLPLSNDQTGVLGTQLRKLGFFFGGVIPQLRDVDVLRLQYLNNVEISPEDISVSSDFGRTLLDFILQDKSDVTA